MRIVQAPRWRRVATAVALLGALYVGARWLFAAPEPKYLTAKAERVTLESSVLATGTLQAIRQVDVGTRVSGQLKSLRVKLGDQVRKGDLLAEIDPVLPENELRVAQAKLIDLEAQKRAAQAKLRRSRLELTRQRGMIKGAMTSSRDVETAEAQALADDASLAALDAQIAQARAQVEIAQANLAYTRITAPMDGEVVAVLTQEGQTVVAVQIVPVILKLAELGAMTVKTQISEADVIRVRVGQPVSFTIMGDPEKRYTAKLRAIEPAPQNYAEQAATSGSGPSSSGSNATAAVFYNALFDAPNPDRLLRIGMTAQVSIQIGDAKQALAIPSSALRNKGEDGRYSVRVLTKGNKAETRQVRIGLDNYVRTEVLDGIAEGESVITGEPDTAGVTP